MSNKLLRIPAALGSKNANVYVPARILFEIDEERIEMFDALLHREKPSDDKFYQVERDAWDVARLLADKLGIKRDEYYVSQQLRQMRRLGY